MWTGLGGRRNCTDLIQSRKPYVLFGHTISFNPHPNSMRQGFLSPEEKKLRPPDIKPLAQGHAVVSGQIQILIQFFWPGSFPLADASNSYVPGICYLLQTLLVPPSCQITVSASCWPALPGATAGMVHIVWHWTSLPASAALSTLLHLLQGPSSFSRNWSREFYCVLLRIRMYVVLEDRG